MTHATNAPPVLEADLAAALDKLPERQRGLLTAELTRFVERLAPKPPAKRRSRRAAPTPQPADAPAFWYGFRSDTNGEAA